MAVVGWSRGGEGTTMGDMLDSFRPHTFWLNCSFLNCPAQRGPLLPRAQLWTLVCFRCSSMFCDSLITRPIETTIETTLWQILRVYGVHAKLVELLEDVHKGTQAAVRMG